MDASYGGKHTQPHSARPSFASLGPSAGACSIPVVVQLVPALASSRPRASLGHDRTVRRSGPPCMARPLLGHHARRHRHATRADIAPITCKAVIAQAPKQAPVGWLGTARGCYPTSLAAHARPPSDTSHWAKLPGAPVLHRSQLDHFWSFAKVLLRNNLSMPGGDVSPGRKLGSSA